MTRQTPLDKDKEELEALVEEVSKGEPQEPAPRNHPQLQAAVPP